jgi:peptidoglycan biosynthesis protein MviN/MurJ (putative lipid II flippase)
MLKKILKVFSVSTVGKIFGFIKIQLLTSYFGANSYTDAIIVVMNIYWFWSNEIVFSLFSNTLIPKLAKITNHKSQLYQVLRVLCSANILTFSFFAAVILFNRQIVYLFAPMASVDFFNNASLLMLLMAPLALLIPLTEIFTLHNQFKEKYFISAINMTVWNLFQIIAILLAYRLLDNKLLIYLFALFTLVSYLVTTYIQLGHSNYLIHFKFKYLIFASFKSFKQNISDNLSFFISTVLFQLNIYINYAFISKLSKGSITTFDIILKVPSVFQSLLMSSLAVIYFNAISKESNRVLEYYWKFTKGMVLLVLPLLVGVYFFGRQILYFVYNEEIFIGRNGIHFILLAGFVNIYFMGKLSLLIKAIIVNLKGKILLYSTLVACVSNSFFVFLIIDNYNLPGVIFVTLLVNIILSLFLQFQVFRKEKLLINIFFADAIVIIFSYFLLNSL